ncbi:MAG: O-antigen ligase family protein [Limisphaerales bacterium]
MRSPEQSSNGGTGPGDPPSSGSRGGRRHAHASHRPRTPKAYDVCDWLTEGVLYLMVIFGPWAFGTTQVWSTWVMNVAAYVLGALLATKWIVRWRTGYQPVRWGQEREDGGQMSDVGSGRGEGRSLTGMLTVALATLTVVILGYCLVSAVNARNTYHHDRRWFEPHNFIGWLPHSDDSSSTWFVSWQYLGLACVFWAVRDWLLGKTRSERRSASEERRASPADLGGPSIAVHLSSGVGHLSPSSPVQGSKFDVGGSMFSQPSPSSILPPPSSIPARLRRLLWVICLNGTALAIESILQRLDGSGRLLWLVQPRWNTTAISQFGPYAYRSNAAEYFNLVWPVCLGFWWALRRAAKRSRTASARVGAGAHVVLLPCAVLMAASPIISTARGGAIIAAGGILIATALLLSANRHGGWPARIGILSLFLVTLGFAAYLGWGQLEKRLETVFSDDLGGRTEIYEHAHVMAEEFPWLGSGPGTFASLYQLYRSNPEETWAAWVHDDWLETRITFGRIGFTLILLALAGVFIRWFGPDGIHLPRTTIRLIWLAMVASLLHARFDFPLQVYSILFVFVLWCALLFCASRE